MFLTFKLLYVCIVNVSAICVCFAFAIRVYGLCMCVYVCVYVCMCVASVGGGIYSEHVSELDCLEILIKNSKFIGNSAKIGGGIACRRFLLSEDTIIISERKYIKNLKNESIVYSNVNTSLASHINLQNVTMIFNNAWMGAGIYVSPTNYSHALNLNQIQNNIENNNNNNNNGNPLYFQGICEYAWNHIVTINHSLINNNTAVYNGGGYFAICVWTQVANSQLRLRKLHIYNLCFCFVLCVCVCVCVWLCYVCDLFGAMR